MDRGRNAVGVVMAMIKSVAGDMPVWMIVLIGFVVLAALVLGLRGGRKTSEREHRAEPEASTVTA